MDNSLIKLIEKSGYSNKEARVYLSLLELGQGDVTDIAKIARLKRSIIYVVLESLEARGLVNQLPNKKINTYQAHDPALILAQLKENAQDFSQMLPFLQSLRNKTKKRPRMSFIDNKEGIWKVNQEMFHSQEAFIISSCVRFQEHFPESMEVWAKDYNKGLYSIKTKFLIPENSEEVRLGKILKKAEQQVKTSPILKNVSMDFILFKNKFALTLLEENPFMVLIESEELVNSLKPIFDYLWKNSKKI